MSFYDDNDISKLVNYSMDRIAIKLNKKILEFTIRKNLETLDFLFKNDFSFIYLYVMEVFEYRNHSDFYKQVEKYAPVFSQYMFNKIIFYKNKKAAEDFIDSKVSSETVRDDIKKQIFDKTNIEEFKNLIVNNKIKNMHSFFCIGELLLNEDYINFIGIPKYKNVDEYKKSMFSKIYFSKGFCFPKDLLLNLSVEHLNKFVMFLANKECLIHNDIQHVWDKLEDFTKRIYLANNYENIASYPIILEWMAKDIEVNGNSQYVDLNGKVTFSKVLDYVMNLKNEKDINCIIANKYSGIFAFQKRAIKNIFKGVNDYKQNNIFYGLEKLVTKKAICFSYDGNYYLTLSSNYECGNEDVKKFFLKTYEDAINDRCDFFNEIQEFENHYARIKFLENEMNKKQQVSVSKKKI